MKPRRDTQPVTIERLSKERCSLTLLFAQPDRIL
jgi:hypothetical protein